MRSEWALPVVSTKIINRTNETVVTIATATNGSGRIFSPCLRKLCEIAEINEANNIDFEDTEVGTGGGDGAPVR